MNCQAAHQFCDTELTVPMFSSGWCCASYALIIRSAHIYSCLPGLSVYDIRTVCEGEVTETLCYYISL